MDVRRTQVAIVGAGPAGLMLGQLLHIYGIDNVILERRSAEYVLGRIRAGVLEPSTIAALVEVGAGADAQRQGIRVDAVNLRWDEQCCRIDFALAHKCATVYGQTRVTRDLMQAREASGRTTVYEAADVAPHDFDGRHPWVSYRVDGREARVDCDFIAGCDGFHGISRQSLPKAALREYEKTFPFGWLGLLADVPPVSDEPVWGNQPDGFVMCSLRSKTRSRYYLQVPAGEDIEAWNADRFWDAFRQRLPAELAAKLVTGPALEMSITPLHSYVCATMRAGRLFLVGDAVHVVPPTGAKGLNLAISDARQLADGLRRFYEDHESEAIDQYEARALGRVWKAVRFSWWMTNLTHRISAEPIERQIQLAELEFTRDSIAAQTAIAENFCGLD